MWRLEAGGLLDLASSSCLTMSLLMGDLSAEPKPGTALRTIVEEHRHLNDFMAMLKAKMELDEKLLSGLKALRESWNPEWKGSGIWPLVSPFLIHINDEIAQRENAATELNSRFTALPNIPSPNVIHKDGFDPLKTMDSVEIRYYQCESRHKIISTPKSINELKKWQEECASWCRPSNNFWVLPKPELEYRRAVVAQQTAVEHTVKWQADSLPGVLEHHQQHSEDVKSFLNSLFTCYCSLHSDMSISCSAALDSNRTFSSSEFIAPRHDESGKETSHALLRAVDYRNYMRDGEVSRPLFGLGVERTASLINKLLSYNPVIYHIDSNGSWLRQFFELEADALRSPLSALLERLSKEDRTRLQLYMSRVFFIDEPILPLFENVMRQYQNGISRAKLSSIMATYLPLAGQEVLTLVVRLADLYKAQYPRATKTEIWQNMASYLSHGHYEGGSQIVVIESIWRKWDIENGCPLPKGVERVWRNRSGKSEVVWRRGGRPYYGSAESAQ